MSSFKSIFESINAIQLAFAEAGPIGLSESKVFQLLKEWQTINDTLNLVKLTVHNLPEYQLARELLEEMFLQLSLEMKIARNEDRTNEWAALLQHYHIAEKVGA